jgi:MoxR-like ATPase
MARKTRKSRSIRAVSPATAARLASVLALLGGDATQPHATVMALPWVATVMQAFRPAVIVALRAMAGGTAGFDYGPLGLTAVRWVAINRLARYEDPAAIWVAAQKGEVVPPLPKGKRKAPAITVAPAAAPVTVPVAGATGTTTATPTPAAPHGVAAPAAAPVPPVTGAVPTAAAIPEPQPLDVGAAPTQWAQGVSPAEAAHPEWDWQPASKVFGVKGLWGKVAVWPRHGEEGAHERTKKVDPHYEWPKAHLQWAVFAAGEAPAKGCWFWGNRGAGKTEFAKQFAAHTGRPYYGVTFTKTMEPMDFIGSDGAKGGDSAWRDGTILQGLKCKVPAVIMFDEISYGQSSHISGPLNEIVHPDCSFNVPSTGEVVNFCDGHLFVAGDNTNGTGDTTGMYVGANSVNRATMDRFSFFRRFTYLPKALEVRMLMSRAGCTEALATKVWGILDALRKKVDSGLLSDPPSTREAIALCCALRAGFDEKDAFETCFVGKYAEESQEEMRVTFVATFNATPAA